MSKVITIIDYGVGNLNSIRNMYKTLGIEAKISGDPKEILAAEKLILPGVGKFDYGMSQLCNASLVDVLNEKVLREKTPILGICLGAQLLTEGSEEGVKPGLGWIKGKTVAFNSSLLQQNQKTPHMGWAEVKEVHNSVLFEAMFEQPRFYFVHSFHLKVANESDIIIEANYGYDFTAGVQRDNIYGVQFHPEKSGHLGLQLLTNFIAWAGRQ